ncbi:MAG TPA: serine--tRNA ligase [Gemmatimonadetes bacterium]|jgi:seryl-tRNA synthetase|nr:serine--tRNA ligase [Gemmatimonadota bacterium]HBD96880.1 serine--tRNA ligase [Gemmatimonadota bacterium]HIC55326.1 serine--tRNA ligase [Gemmatimonadota bacterium]HIN49612.1 serine--tRNA ligase [Gemmatimonadota bacterium]
MLDIRRLRHETEAVKDALARRDSSLPDLVDRVLELDVTRREALGVVNDLKAQRNEVSKRVGELKREGADAEAPILEMREVGVRIGELDVTIREADEEIEALLLGIPNTPFDEVPEGDEDHNVLLSCHGSPATFDFEPRPHWELGETLGILDLARGSKVSGSGFPVLLADGARLQRGLINFFLDVHVDEHAYTEVRVPYLVTSDTMTGTGQLPKFAEESYQTERDELWLIPTAEVPVTNLHRDELLAADDLPLRYTAYTPCFRREAGAAGKDTRGLLRVHQFDKVELVRYELPERSREALEELTREAEVLLERLGLHYRRLLLATGDLGQSGALTYDLEVWAPGVDKWLEVSSCTTFTDYQARRANIRFRRSQAEKPEFVHTLNGSALALPRVMAALLETYQQADGSVVLPPVLHPYVGLDRLTPST